MRQASVGPTDGTEPLRDSAPPDLPIHLQAFLSSRVTRRMLRLDMANMVLTEREMV